MTRTTSSNVHSVGYEPSTGTMRVAFRSGGVYDYFGVPSELFNQMLLPYPWRRVGRVVRRHRYTRVA